jgi:hypothetical protein
VLVLVYPVVAAGARVRRSMTQVHPDAIQPERRANQMAVSRAKMMTATVVS